MVQAEAIRVGRGSGTEFFPFDGEGRHSKVFLNQVRRAPAVCSRRHKAPVARRSTSPP